MKDYFSLNNDEATRDVSHKKIFTILVIYIHCFSFEKYEVVVGNIKSLNLKKVTSSILFESMTTPYLMIMTFRVID